MEYAVRLADLTGIENEYRCMLVRPVVGETVEIDKSAFDAGAVVLLDCPEERARAIIHFLLKDKGKKGPARCYKCENGRWKAIHAVD